ncbi:hypothetical protein BS17DRAFT_860915 [Gyrodon lividus]|nr:hypothetical protein BS17DRAFT_860915 [Gyrodon lividus]
MDNYHTWRIDMKYTLAAEDLWYHISTETNLTDPLNLASFKPVPTDPKSPTEAETTAIRKWLVDNLEQYGNSLDVITGGKTSMGANFSKEESVFQLLTGLPLSSEWRLFKLQIEQHLHDADSRTVITSALGARASISTTFQHNAMTFNSCSTRICGEASCQLNKKALNGPGSEYAHMASMGAIISSKTNPITGLCKHAKNPQGIFCTTPICSANHHGDHNHAHCFSSGGGMEGQAPWQKKKKRDGASSSGTPTPAASGTSTPITPPAHLPAMSATAVASSFVMPEGAQSFLGDLSCASIVPFEAGGPSSELAAHIHSALSTILDSGMTTTLVCNWAHFWSFSHDSSPTVHTANHGFLPTSGHGDCVAILTIGGVQHQVPLSNCLHAPDAMLNLLSVGWMLNKGWECNFKGDPSCCDFVYCGHPLSSLPLSGNLCFIDLEFMPPLLSGIPPFISPAPEVSAFTVVPLMLNLLLRLTVQPVVPGKVLVLILVLFPSIKFHHIPPNGIFLSYQ